MNDQDSRRRRKSALDTLNDIYTTASRIRQGAQIAGMLASNFWIIIGVAAVLTIFVFILTFTGGEAAGIGGSGTDQVTPSQGTVTSLPPGSNVRQEIINKFGVTMDGFDADHLQAAWEKLSETSTTSFPSLIKGVKIQAASGNTSSQIGCAGGISIRLVPHQPLSFFKFILTHELGHVIANCLSRNLSKLDDQRNAYIKEGGVSFYANNAVSCTSSDGPSEDYADMIAYYLNPSAGLSTSICGGRAPINPPNPLFIAPSKKLHYDVARSVLEPNKQ